MTTKTSEDELIQEFTGLLYSLLKTEHPSLNVDDTSKDLVSIVRRYTRPITQNKSQDELRTIIAQNISNAIQGVKEYPQKDIEEYYRNRGQWVDLMTERIMEAVESQTRSITAIKEAIGPNEDNFYGGLGYTNKKEYRNELRTQIRAALQLDEGDV